MTRSLFSAAALLAVASTAVADEYWVSYQGNDYPENEGWRRWFSDENGVFGRGGAIRTLENGSLVLDSRAAVLITDYYDMVRPVDPEQGEVFIMRWRLKIDSVSGPYGVSVGVFSDDSRGVGFQFGESSVRSAFEQNVSVTFDPQAFHLFEVTSSDMHRYVLSIDGAPMLDGQFMPAGPPSRIIWGDSIQGPLSLSRWDLFEFGVVPEPSALISAACVSLAAIRTRWIRNPPRSQS